MHAWEWAVSDRDVAYPLNRPRTVPYKVVREGEATGTREGGPGRATGVAASPQARGGLGRRSGETDPLAVVTVA
ncbi:hypothetical protein GCM10007887_01630 [Methylobacterium haplocladii]|uniref:Uncharacterized protein n=1 Tax=Methylobacterium haplocladii TaxID=1176176 RepID=A0A512IJH7_9HYPH|nr:hypothetical protein MHA02_02480 [Methylobacterium haplocladii]GLS57508.1 hypothetical protein GCM10007887_01630 [Methylobacterium haplocladii]